MKSAFQKFYETYRKNKLIPRKELKQELIDMFMDLAKIYSPSGHERAVIQYCSSVLVESGFDVKMDGIGNIIAERGRTSPEDKLVCINAHTDTVQRDSDRIIATVVFYDIFTDTVHTNRRAMVGGDDKCGLAVGLTLARYTDLPIKIIFNPGEEIGGLGMEALDPSHMNGLAFTLTVDRQNGNDLISEYCGLICAPDTFVTKFIELSKSIGVEYKDTGGSYADTYIICKHAPAVNLSAGYYNPHTSYDYVKMNELYNTMRAVKNAIEHKQELLDAIAAAPKDWQVDYFEGYGGMNVYEGYGGGHYGGYYGAVGHYGGKASNRKQRRRNMKKCKLKFGSKFGFDDKSKVKYGMPNPDPDAKYTPDELIEAYASNQITDDEWDDMYDEHAISQDTYIVGIDELIYREQLGETDEFSMDTIDSETPEFESGFTQLIDLDDVPENEHFNLRQFDELEPPSPKEMGFRSGFTSGTIEDSIFTDYLSGEMTYPELEHYERNYTITREFLNYCVKSRQQYIVDISPRQKITATGHVHKDRSHVNLTQKRTLEEWMEILKREGYSEADWYTLYKGGFIDMGVYNSGLDVIDDLEYKKRFNKVDRAMKGDITESEKTISGKNLANYSVEWLNRLHAGAFTIEQWDKLKETGVITDQTHYNGLVYFDPSELMHRMYTKSKEESDKQWKRVEEVVKKEIRHGKHKNICGKPDCDPNTDDCRGC